jgi:Zn-dependent M28 family amino/carboxypeptidase
MNVMRVPREAIVPQQPWDPAPIIVDPNIVAIANRITAANLEVTVRRLAAYVTRNSMSTNATQATRDLQKEWQDGGANATLQAFRSGYCSNVIGEIRGSTNATWITMIGGHLDSRAASSTNATQPAPGADDNASGLAVVIELFQSLVHHMRTSNFKIRKTVRFYAWCGEEQGLYGSDYAAKDSKSRNENIDSYLNCDMLGYKPLNPVNSTLGIVDRAVSAPFTAEMRSIISEYYPSLPMGSATACCSDQQSYNTQGYAAGGLFEQTGASVTYPQYHTANDTPDRLNYTQLQMFGRAAAVVFLTRVGIYV